MEYRCISADCHIDLSFLPHDLFVSSASRAMKERMPYVVEGPDGPMWTTKSGIDLRLANSKGAAGVSGIGRKYVPGTVHRMDRMASTGLFADAADGIFRPTTPELRLQDQDRDGIQAEVLYGLHGAGSKMKDPEATVEFYRIYNDWLVNFCSYDRKRLVGLASIPCHNVEVAVAEALRVARLGVGGLDFLASYGMTPIWTPYWDPFWRVASELNLPVHFHTIGPPPDAHVAETLPEDFKQAGMATRTTGGTLHVAPLLAGMIHGGALERYPSLRIVFGESGIGWIPYVLDRMDYEYEDRYLGRIPIKMKPSEYWRRQCRATFQNDRIGVKNLDDLGIETVMWASDYPHPDGVFPDSQEYIQRQFGRLPGEVKHRITCENAGRFYGLIST